MSPRASPLSEPGAKAVLGAPCAVDADCPDDKACFDERCLCRPGFAACGEACVDLAADPQHCGVCDVACSSGLSCEAGLCQRSGEAPDAPAAVVEPAGEIDGMNAESFCRESNEAYPEESANTGTAQLVMPYQSTYYAGSPRGPYNWGMSCANALHDYIDDGPAIHYDLGGTALYAVANRSGVGHRLHIMRDCGYGQPGGASCPVTSNITVSSSAQFHPNVVVNPCTHHAMVAYFEGDNDLMIKFYSDTGIYRGSYLVEKDVSWGSTSDCLGCANEIPVCCPWSACSGLTPCMHPTRKPQVVTKVWHKISGDVCYAYVAYDTTCPGGDGRDHSRGTLRILDITNESNVSEAKAYRSSGCGLYSHDDFEIVATASQYNRNVGFFFYRQQDNDPCATYFRGATDTALGLSSMTHVVVAGPFPTMWAPLTDGLGHYVGIVKRGLPGGYLFPTWSQPVPTTESCSPLICDVGQPNEQDYSLAIFGARVTP